MAYKQPNPKKTKQGSSVFTKWGHKHPKGNSKHYRKKYRGQGRG